jgi:Raf kinase inhibitor-like YbhB/YbcL family protein
MKRNIFLILSLIIFLTASLVLGQEGEEKMKLSSPDFKNNDFIPDEFTCLGEDVNPNLVIENIPAETKTLALIVDDPDAPMGTWVHWVVFNIPVTSKIESNSIPGEQAINNFGSENYGGPCPPFGTHRYFFKIYALDTEFESAQIKDKASLEKFMLSHILDSAELMGLFKK